MAISLKNNFIQTVFRQSTGSGWFFRFVKGMHPVHFQKVDQEYDAAAGPGDGIGPGNRGQLIDKPHGNGNIGYPEQAPAGQHGEHGNSGLSGAPHNTGNAVGKGQQKIKQTDVVKQLQLRGVDISIYTYNRIEKGTQNPTVSCLLGLCDILKCDMNAIFEL